MSKARAQAQKGDGQAEDEDDDEEFGSERAPVVGKAIKAVSPKAASLPVPLPLPPSAPPSLPAKAEASSSAAAASIAATSSTGAAPGPATTVMVVPVESPEIVKVACRNGCGHMMDASMLPRLQAAHENGNCSKLNAENKRAKKAKAGADKAGVEEEAQADFAKVGSKRRAPAPAASEPEAASAPVDLSSFLVVGSSIYATQNPKSHKVNWYLGRILDFGDGKIKNNGKVDKALVGWETDNFAQGGASWLPMTSQFMEIEGSNSSGRSSRARKR